MAQEFLFSELDKYFEPKSHISPDGLKSKWRAVPYRTGDICGTMLSSLPEGTPEDICFDPQLTGWHKIYIAVPAFHNLELNIKLSQDKGFFKVGPSVATSINCTHIEESFWRYAKMDGQAFIVSKSYMDPRNPRPSMLAWLRFVPMTEEEVAALLAERTCKDHKRIYATDDMHNRLYHDRPSVDPDFWQSVVLPYEDSDVEWLSLERITAFISGNCPQNDPENYAFLRSGDRVLQEQRDTYDSPAITKDLVRTGHERGLKMSLSLRMGAWGIGFPFDQCYFDYDYYLQRPHLRCIMRDGVPAAAFSYAYEEVQQHFIDLLLEMADSGCDAVVLIAHRGIPYLQYEEPVAARFRAAYGEDPYDRPLDDPQLNAIHCQIMMEFFRKVRKALDEAHPDRHIELHLRTLYSIYDTKYIGIDAEALAAEGLLDAIISYPSRYREIYGKDCILPNGRVDMERYKAFVNNPNEKAFLFQSDLLDFPPFPDSHGDPTGPLSLKECVTQWMKLEQKYGVKIYMDILPRIMSPEEQLRRAQELYIAGAERFSLWDTYVRVIARGMWATSRKIGHKAEVLAGFEPDTKLYRVHELAGNNISRYYPIWGG